MLPDTMTDLGTPARPLRVAIVGSGPAAFYAAEHLLKQAGVSVQVDLIERLPTPYGLVRGGVAPDHPKIKSVSATFDKIAALPGFRFFGNLEYGRHLSAADLARHFDAVLFATGAQTDRSLGIPGEDLPGSHSATEFVAWYNGHPDFQDRRFDLAQERAAVIGVGNVALDVARILCLGPGELRGTDMADAALAALCESRVREVHVIGRRGPVQAAFTNNELKELGELAEADVVVRPDEAEPDPLSAEELAASPRPAMRAKVEILQGFASRPPAGKPRRMTLRFLLSPVEILGRAEGRVTGLRLERNVLERDAAGRLTARGTGAFETLPVGLVFRSVGYKGLPLPGLPFDERAGTVPHVKGRVTDPAGGDAFAGRYVSGWIKRGPSGVIGNNKACSVETVNTLLADLAAGALPRAERPEAAAFETLVRERQPRAVTFADWRRLDALEVERGRSQDRPRVKYTSVEAMLSALAAD
jgi:ferredoxin--NADP+ reductase